jgi:hypothetical protein
MRAVLMLRAAAPLLLRDLADAIEAEGAGTVARRVSVELAGTLTNAECTQLAGLADCLGAELRRRAGGAS